MQIGSGHLAVRTVLALQRGHRQTAEPPGATGHTVAEATGHTVAEATGHTVAEATEHAAAVAENTTTGSDITVADGYWACAAVAATTAEVPLLLWCPQLLRGPEAAEVCQALQTRAGEAYQVSAKTMGRLSSRDRPDGLLATVRLPQFAAADFTPPEPALIAVADGIEQPGNLGTLIRTLDACGAAALIMTNTRTRLANPKVFRASHATTLRVPSLTFATATKAATWLAEHGFGIYLADTGATRCYTDIQWRPRSAVVLGNERFGIDPVWRTSPAESIRIPMLGNADSLNVSISAAVLLYEARSQLSGWRG